MGAKKADINRKAFEAMLEVQCTREDIYRAFHVAKNTLQAWIKENYEGRTFEDVAAEFRAKGNISMRRKLFQMAQSNPTLMIFYAKNYLGMSDQPKPIDTGEEQKALANSIAKATKTISKMDISSMADIPGMNEEDIL